MLLVEEDAPPEQIVAVLVLLGVVALGAFVAPVAVAAFSRASERAADAYAGATMLRAVARSGLIPSRLTSV